MSDAADTSAHRLCRRLERELILRMAEDLAAPDRQLVESVYRDGQSAGDRAGRLRTLMRRLTDSRTLIYAAIRTQLGPTAQSVLAAHLVRGESLESIADRLALSPDVVRRPVDAINAAVRHTQRRACGGCRTDGTPEDSSSAAA